LLRLRFLLLRLSVLLLFWLLSLGLGIHCDYRPEQQNDGRCSGHSHEFHDD
jgi:hypothetical protein